MAKYDWDDLIPKAIKLITEQHIMQKDVAISLGVNKSCLGRRLVAYRKAHPEIEAIWPTHSNSHPAKTFKDNVIPYEFRRPEIFVDRSIYYYKIVDGIQVLKGVRLTDVDLLHVFRPSCYVTQEAAVNA